MKAGEHGPDEKYDKFTVIKNSTGLELDQSIEFIFVLRPETDDKAALAALETYADVCEEAYPNLAGTLRTEVARIRRLYPEGNPAAKENGKPKNWDEVKTHTAELARKETTTSLRNCSRNVADTPCAVCKAEIESRPDDGI